FSLLITDGLFFIFFFFQAEDGIRDWSVTGVQTCALPICQRTQLLQLACSFLANRELIVIEVGDQTSQVLWVGRGGQPQVLAQQRSEERRVGKEGRSRWAPYREKKKESR